MLICGKWIVVGAGVELGTGQEASALVQVSDGDDLH